MTNEEYLKQIAKHVQRNSEGKGLGNYLNPGTKKVNIQFFKRKKISSYDKDQKVRLSHLVSWFQAFIQVAKFYLNCGFPYTYGAFF